MGTQNRLQQHTRRRLGQFLRRARHQAGLSVQQVAGHMHCSSLEFLKLEDGRISASQLWHLCHLYQVPSPELLRFFQQMRREAVKFRETWPL